MKRTSIALATAFTLSCTAVSLPEAEEIIDFNSDNELSEKEENILLKELIKDKFMNRIEI